MTVPVEFLVWFCGIVGGGLFLQFTVTAHLLIRIFWSVASIRTDQQIADQKILNLQHQQA